MEHVQNVIYGIPINEEMSSIMLTFSCWLNFSALDYLLKSTNPKWLEGLTFYTAQCCITFWMSLFSDYKILPTLIKHRNALLCFSNKRFYATLKSIQPPLAQCDIWVTLAVAFGRYAGINKSMMRWMLQLDDDDSQGRYKRKGINRVRLADWAY